MEPIVEADMVELKDIDEFFSWDEDEDEFYNEFEEFALEERPNDLPDYANDIRYNLKQLLSHMQTREPE